MTEINAERLANMRRICTLSDEFICGFLAHDDRYHAEHAGAEVSEDDLAAFQRAWGLIPGMDAAQRAGIAAVLARRRVVAQRQQRGVTDEMAAKVLDHYLGVVTASTPDGPVKWHWRSLAQGPKLLEKMRVALTTALATPPAPELSAQAKIPEGARESAAQDATALHAVPEPDLAALCERAAEEHNKPWHIEQRRSLENLLRAFAAHHRAEAARRQREGEAWKRAQHVTRDVVTVLEDANAFAEVQDAWRALADLAREMGK